MLGGLYKGPGSFETSILPSCCQSLPKLPLKIACCKPAMQIGSLAHLSFAPREKPQGKESKGIQDRNIRPIIRPI